MEPSARKKFIMESVESGESIHVSDLARICSTSEMTIRRDLAKLEETGYLTVHRGVVSLSRGNTKEVSSYVKASRAANQKKNIAKAAVELIETGDCIYLDCGTTVKELAMELSKIRRLTVYTNSLLVCNVLCNYSNITLHLLPGQFSETSMGALDTTTVDALRYLHFDIAFLGTEAINPKLGFMVPELDDCSCKRIIMAHSQKTVVLSDSSKVYMRARYIYAEPQEIPIWITDNMCSQEVKDQFTASGVQVLTV